MSGGFRSSGRTSLLLITLAILLLVTGFASVSLISMYSGAGSAFPAIVLVGTGPISILAVLFVVLALSRPEGVEEVFLVHDSGLLLVHFSKTVRPEKDRDIVIGMLTAVQGFVKDAFAKGGSNELQMMEFGEQRILIARGTYSYLAILLRGRVPLRVQKRMRRTLEKVELTYRKAIEKWNGSADALAGADDILIEGLLGDELRQWANQFRLELARLLRFLSGQRIRAEPKIPPARTTRTDPRLAARRLMERPEIETFKPEYREMILASLQELREGRFTLAGLGNLYMTMAMQKSPRSGAVGWWDLMLRTVRAALRTWPWDPESQSWVMPGAPFDAEPVPARSAPAPADVAKPQPSAAPLDAAAKRPVVAVERAPESPAQAGGF